MRICKVFHLYIFLSIFLYVNQAWTQLVTPPVQSQRPQLNRNFLPMLKDGSPAAFVRFPRPRQTHGLAMVNPENAGYISDVFQGFEGVMPAPGNPDNSLYFQTATDQLLVATGTFFVTIEYFDRGQGAVELEYVTGDDKGVTGTRSMHFFLGNSGNWLSHTFTLSGAVFNHSMPGDTDFRLRCPGVPIRQVSITRSPPPRANQDQVLSPIFDQPSVTPPPGFLFALYADLEIGEALSEEILRQKSQLYRSWGTTNVIEALDMSRLTYERGRMDFTLYRERAELFYKHNLNWVPQISVGDLGTLPASVRNALQPAMGVGQQSPGPMVSLWDEEIVRFYSDAFSALRQSIPPTRLSMLVLSFPGHWGPLFPSQSTGKTGPDIWAGDPLAVRAFQTYIQNLYRSVAALNRSWGTSYGRWNDVTLDIEENRSAMKRYDVLTWYRNAFSSMIDQITRQARSSFPQIQIVLEIGDNFFHGAVDPRAIATIAARNGCSIVMNEQSPMPSESYMWQLLSHQCRLVNVPFGLRFNQSPSAEGIMRVFYSLLSEGGTTFFFNEEQLASEQTWKRYLLTVPDLFVSRPDRSIAVLFPRTSMNAFGVEEFERIIRQMRELFSFDLVDELDVSRLSSYSFIFVPWGHLWSDQVVQQLFAVVRNGAALIVHTNQPWQTLDGGVDFNEDLFAVKVERKGNGWVMSPRVPRPDPIAERSRASVLEGQLLDAGTPQAAPYLTGEWSTPQTGNPDSAQGINYPRFRWMGERGQVNFNVQPGRKYTLAIDAFIPQGNRINVFVNGRNFGEIEGRGRTIWSRELQGRWQPRSQDVDVTFRGQTWSAGNVVGATQAFRPSMAVYQVALLPPGETLDTFQKTAPELSPELSFRREHLRGSWLREIGRGVTVIAPSEYVSQWVFMELLNSIIQYPKLLDAQYNLVFPPDGQINNVYVSMLQNTNLYLNLNRRTMNLSTTPRQRNQRVRTVTLPPLSMTTIR
jgi:hypothetical protein